METYEFWLVTTVLGLMIAAIGFFVKRTIAGNEKANEARDKRIGELEGKLNSTIKEMPFLYTLREDFIRAQANTDRKLDDIIKLLNRQGGGKIND